MGITIVQIKVVHTVIFWILSLCVLYALYSGIADHITLWTWIAVGLLLVVCGGARVCQVLAGGRASAISYSFPQPA